MSVECFRRRRFREPSLRLITLLSSIASDYADDGLKLTVRQFTTSALRAAASTTASANTRRSSGY
jgi:hypothetical protein